MVADGSNTTWRNTHREPLTAEDAYVYNVGKRRSTTTKIINDVRPSKLPVTFLTILQDAPAAVHEKSPRKLPLTDADAKVPNVERRLPPMAPWKNPIPEHARGAPGGDPLLDEVLGVAATATTKVPKKKKGTVALHFDRKLPARDAEWLQAARHYQMRTTDHYCPVNPGHAGDPLPDPSLAKQHRSKSAWC